MIRFLTSVRSIMKLSIYVIVVRYLQIKINLIPFFIMETGVWYS